MNYYIKAKRMGGKIEGFNSIDEVNEYVALGKLNADDLMIEAKGRSYSELPVHEEWVSIKHFTMHPPKRDDVLASIRGSEDVDNSSFRPLSDVIKDRFQTLSGYGIFLSVFGWIIMVLGLVSAVLVASKLGVYQAVLLGVFSVLFGIGFVVYGQMVACFVAIEKNGRITNELLKRLQ